MLGLINIEKTNNTIRAEYVPEASEEIGMVEVSIENREIISSQKTSFDKPVESYLRQAAGVLRDMLSEPSIPRTRLVMWY